MGWRSIELIFFIEKKIQNQNVGVSIRFRKHTHSVLTLTLTIKIIFGIISIVKREHCDEYRLNSNMLRE